MRVVNPLSVRRDTPPARPYPEHRANSAQWASYGVLDGQLRYQMLCPTSEAILELGHPGLVPNEPHLAEPLGNMPAGHVLLSVVRFAAAAFQHTASAEVSNGHSITIEFMIFVISTLTGAQVCELMNELDRCDPLHHFEPELIFATQP